MAEEARPPDGRLEHPSVKYEPTDASFGAVLFVIVAALGFAAFLHFAILVFFTRQNAREAEAKKSSFPLAPRPSEKRPEGPRLEQIDRLDGVERPNVYLREASRESDLNRYGAAREEGFVHIPIERAMTLRVEGPYKLPSRTELPPANQRMRSRGLVDAGESNSGREYRGRPR